tara:strand:- start:92 stop:1297 length:1206 start_codon:yes stop_codon:yes gene_type:complete
MALGTWKEDPKENAILQESFADLGGNADNLTRDQKLRKAEQAHVIAGKTKVANEQKKGSDSHDSSIYLSYPVARTNSEKTGDTLRIKCLEYIPPESGAGLGVTVSGAFYETNDGERKVIKKEMREKGGAFEGSQISIKSSLEDANSRINRKQKTKYYIELPIPQEVNDSNSVTWGEDKVNALELAALAVAQNAMKGGVGQAAVETAQVAVEAMNTGINIPGIQGQTADALRAALSGAAIGQLGSQVSPQSVIARSTGQILNNNLELLFAGVNLRSFPYSITFSPRSPREGRVVKTIIRSLKQSMAPKAGEFNETSQGIFLKSPDVFQLDYLKDGRNHPFLNDFKLCALTGMTVNYTNAGTYASYEDGTPVNIRMNLTFKELNPIYNEDYLPGNGTGEGVGF